MGAYLRSQYWRGFRGIGGHLRDRGAYLLCPLLFDDLSTAFPRLVVMAKLGGSAARICRECRVSGLLRLRPLREQMVGGCPGRQSGVIDTRSASRSANANGKQQRSCCA